MAREDPLVSPTSQDRIGPLGDPFINMETLAVVIKPLTHPIHLELKPIWSIMLNKKSQLRLSNAFSKSTLRRKSRTLERLAHAMISSTISGPSTILLPGTKAVCSGLITESITTFNRPTKTLEMILLTLPMVIV